jgi:hypothetical protein
MNAQLLKSILSILIVALMARTSSGNNLCALQSSPTVRTPMVADVMMQITSQATCKTLTMQTEMKILLKKPSHIVAVAMPTLKTWIERTTRMDMVPTKKTAEKQVCGYERRIVINAAVGSVGRVVDVFFGEC